MGARQSTPQSHLDAGPLEYIEHHGINLSDSKLIDQIGEKHYIYRININFSHIFSNNLDLFNQIIYDKQRPIDTSRCAQIAKFVNSKNNHFWGSISVGYIQGYAPRLLDGQHRLTAAQYIDAKKHFPAHLHIIQFPNAEQMYDYFSTDINSGIQVPLTYLTSHSAYHGITDKIVDLLIAHFSTRVINQTNKFPYISEKKLKEDLFDVISRSRNQDVNEFSLCNPENTATFYANLIIQYNNSLKSIPLQNPLFTKLPHPEKMVNIKIRIDRHQFYLGLVERLPEQISNYLQNHITVPTSINHTNYESDSEISDSDSPDSESDSSQSDSDSEHSNTPILTLRTRQKLVESVFEKCKITYKKVIKTSEHPRIPNLNESTMKEIIHRIIESQLPNLSGNFNDDVKLIKSTIDKFNLHLSKLPPDNDIWIKPKNGKTSTYVQYHQKAKEAQCFLGLLRGSTPPPFTPPDALT